MLGVWCERIAEDTKPDAPRRKLFSSSLLGCCCPVRSRMIGGVDGSGVAGAPCKNSGPQRCGCRGGPHLISFGFRGLRFGNKDLPWHNLRVERAVKRPKGNRTFVPQRRTEHITPADDWGLADLVTAKRPEEEECQLMSIVATLAAPEQRLQ